ncbi:hypothetical protein ACFY19_03080 [Streptosporangium saharense]
MPRHRLCASTGGAALPTTAQTVTEYAAHLTVPRRRRRGIRWRPPASSGR